MSFFERSSKRDYAYQYEAPKGQLEQDSPVPPSRAELKGPALKTRKNRTASSHNLLDDYDEDMRDDQFFHAFPDNSHHPNLEPQHHPFFHRHHHHNAAHPYHTPHHSHGHHQEPHRALSAEPPHTSSSSSDSHHHHHHRERGDHHQHHHHHHHSSHSSHSRHHSPKDTVMEDPRAEEKNNGSGSSSPSIQVNDAKQQERLAEKLKAIQKLKSFNIDPYTGEKKLTAMGHGGYKKEHSESPSPSRSSSMSPKRREPESSPRTKNLFGW